MKLHLPPPLLHSILSILTTFGISYTLPAHGGVMFDCVPISVYTDYGQNCGRYVAGQVNDMLATIRVHDGGVVIPYVGTKFEAEGKTQYTLQHMIDFSSGGSLAYDAAVGYGFIGSVTHAGTHNPNYAAPLVGSANAVQYTGIEYWKSNTGEYLNTTELGDRNLDLKLTRLSKLVTDVRTEDAFSTTGSPQELEGKMIYRSGSGVMVMYHVKENGMPDPESGVPLPTICGGYTYVSGGVQAIDFIRIDEQEDGSFAAKSEAMNYNRERHSWSGMQNTYDYVTGSNVYGFEHPMPGLCLTGDSGSPSWIWDEASSSYKYFGAMASGESCAGAIIGSGTDWMPKILEKYNVNATLGKGGDHTVTFHAVDALGEEFSGLDNSGNTLTIQKKMGSLTYTDSDGQAAKTDFCGVQSGVNTWNDLANRKDLDNWFNYGGGYLNSGRNVSADSGMIDQGELLQTNNIVLTAVDSTTYSLKLDATVDTGIGYLRLSKAEGVETACFKLISGGQDDNGQDYQLNTAGFVVDRGVTMDIALTADATYMREWRKVGAGDLVISGSGNNNVLLNIGGNSEGANDGDWTSPHREGRLILNRQDGYAAYNVLASTGSTVVLEGGLGQVKRNITLGAGGAVLDLHGHDYEWNNSDTSHFSLYMMAEGDTLANYSGSATVTVKDTHSGLADISQNFIGAFEDSAEGALDVVYDGCGKWTMNTVFTDLSHHSDSSFTVNSGEVVLQGTLTQHAKGSESGTNANRLVRDNDWHYAHAKMDVEVRNNATFTLGSHAFLEGNVRVNAGGTLELHQAVNHAQEYVEGGTMLENVAIYSDHYGLSKDSTVSNEGKLHVKYDAGTDTDTTFKGKLSGCGAVVFEMGTDGGTFTLANDANDFSGTKKIESGGLVATSKAALGNVNDHKYEIGAKGFLAVTGTEWTTDEVLNYVTGTSEGVLALTQNQATALSTEDIPHLIIGAMGEVTYGTKETKLDALDGKWRLGGGGGTLTVDFLLDDDTATLELGNAYTKGTVILTNTGNHIGNIIMYGGVTLKGDPAALGGAKLEVPYGSRLTEASISEISALNNNSQGVLLVESDTEEAIDLRQHTELGIGTDGDTVLNRTITTADDAAYRFGGITGTLTVNCALSGNHDLVVDNQTYSSGTLVLNGATGLTGKVEVMGYNENLTAERAGDICVKLGHNNMLINTQHTTVSNGGVLDLNGTNQTIRNLSIGETGALTDSLGNSTLSLSGENNSVAGILNVNHLHANQATVEVGEQAVWRVSDLSLSDSVLKLGNGNLNGSLQVTGGTSTVQTSGTTSLASLQTSANSVLNLTTEAASIATLQTETGSVLNLTTDTLTLYGTDYSTGAAGRFILKADRLNMSNGDGTSIGGTLELAQDTTLYSDGSKNNMTRSISTLSLANGATATLDSPSWNTIWNIGELTGDGNLLWKANTNHSTPSRLVLGGDNGSFAGKITVERTGGANRSRAWQTYLELGHENAAANAEVTLNGQNDISMVALALNTDTIRMKGLSGNAYAAVYAGAAVTDPALINTAPLSTRNATLLLEGEGTYTYSGTILGDDAHRISLDKSGSGTQTLNGKSVVLGDVYVNNGLLELSAKEGLVGGNVVVRNASVNFNSASLEVAGTISAEHASVNLQQALQSAAQNTLCFSGTGNTLYGQVNLHAVTVGSGAELTLTDAAVSSVISNSGTVHVGSGTVFNVTQADFAAAVREGQALTLIEGQGGSVDAPTTTVMVGGTALADMLATGQSVSYGTEGGSLTATVALADNNIIWTGANSAVWDLKKSSNWKQQSDSAVTTATALSNVIFDSKGTRYVNVVNKGVTTWNMTALSGSYLFQAGAVTVLNDLDLQGTSYVQPTEKMTVLGDVSVASGATLAASAGLDVGGTVYLGGTLSVGTVNNAELEGDIRAERGSGTKGTLTRPKGAEGTLRLSGTVELAAFNAENSTAANATLFSGETSVGTMKLTSGAAAVTGEGTLSIEDAVTLGESGTQRGSLEGRDGEGKRQYAITAPAASTAAVESLNADAAMVLRSNSITNAALKGAVLTTEAGAEVSVKDVRFMQADGTGISLTAAEGKEAGIIRGQTQMTAAGDNTFTLGGTGEQLARLDVMLLALDAGTRLEMANVILGIDSSTKGEAALKANGLTVEADGAALQLQPLTFGDSQTKQVEEPAVIASLTLSNIKDVIIEGAENKGMLVHLVGDYTLGNVDWVKVGLGEGAKFNDGLAVTLLYENEAGQELTVHGQYTMAEVEVQAAAKAAAQNHNYVYFRLTGTVPEPTTGTLSLLALAALAARRRRK